jgi:hypothetical protein
MYAASALAANSFARSSFGGKPPTLSHQIHFCTVGTNNREAAFPLFGLQMYHKLGDQWATTLLAFLTVVMMPFPIIFFQYGKKIRGKSRFATA